LIFTDLPRSGRRCSRGVGSAELAAVLDRRPC